MNIKPLPKTPKLPTSISDNGADLIKALHSQFINMLSTINSLVAGGEDWRTPSLVSGWTNFGAGYNSAGYYKDSTGIVHLRGLVVGDSPDTPIFVLPEGYRPDCGSMFGVITSGGLGRVDILSDGRVLWMTAGSFTYMSLDGILFKAAK